MTDPTSLTRAGIVDLLPHGEALCLIERVTEQAADRIRCLARGPASACNPLLHDGQLATLHAIEYAAQAAAIHGALTNEGAVRPGMIASVPRVAWNRPCFCGEATELAVSCFRHSADTRFAAYGFTVDDAQGVTAEGEVILIFSETDT